MAKRPVNRSERPSHPPLWLVEGLDIVSRKRVLLASVVLAVVFVGALSAVLFPGVVPRTPVVGAAIGLAALLLGLAAAVASDATDLIVRGPRHVAAAGGELVAVLPRDPSVVSAGPLATAVLEVREPGVPLLLALATAGRDARRSNAWTDAIARSLVGEGVGVLRVDLASGRSEQAGLVEVVRDGLRLADAVSFEPGLKLAQLSAGRDHAEALVALTELPGRLPRDLDIMLVSLPTAASRSVVAAATALDHVLVVVERDRTSRVDLIASLDALEAAGTHAQAVLLDTQTALRLAPPVAPGAELQGTRKRAISSTVGTAPVVAPGSEGERVAVPDGEDMSAGEATDDVPEDRVADDEVSEDRVADDVPADEVSDDDRDQADVAAASVPLAGPLAAGVAGAGVAAGLGAIASEQEAGDELDDAAPGAEDDLAVEADTAAEAAPGAEDDLAVEADTAPEAASGAEDGDGTEPAGEQRDVELLEAAAAATAMSIAAAEDEPLDEHFEALPASHDLEDELTQPDEAPLVEEIVELPAEEHHPEGDTPDEAPAPAMAEDGSSSDALEEDDPTDRLPPVVTADTPDTADTPEPDLFAAGDEDLLRTTARLAMLADDLELRGRGEADVDTTALDEPDRNEHDGRA
ncbi:MAG: hypothetical protein R6U94_11240 [Nitriliruptoraceae bacterium]